MTDYRDIIGRYKWIILMLALGLMLTGCATWLEGGKPVVPKGVGQVAVQGYSIADKLCIAVASKPPGVDSKTLLAAYEAALATRRVSDIVLMPKTTAAARDITTAEIIDAAGKVLAIYLQVSAADRFYSGIIRQMQTDDRQVLTDAEKASINIRLDASCVAPG